MPSGGEHYDVVIIGSGPGGGTMAWRLAQTGKRISCSSAAATCPGNVRIGTAKRYSWMRAIKLRRPGTA